MAINKEKNGNLQLTISKADLEQLEQIRADLSEFLNIDLSKSQTITYLIKNYDKTALKTENNEPSKEIKYIERFKNKTLSNRVKELRKQLQVSTRKMAQLFNTSVSTTERLIYNEIEPNDKDLLNRIETILKEHNL